MTNRYSDQRSNTNILKSHSNQLIHQKGKNIVIIFFVMVILSLACSTTNPPLFSTQTPQPTPTIQTRELEPLAAVTFQVEIPPYSPSDQPILLSILDEVTGLALNISRYEMQKIDDHIYSITHPFPVGANIKYRYARQDVYIAEEHTTDGRPVRYRIFRVDGPGTVRDIVSTWSDQSYLGLTGRIMGTVTDSSNNPIPNILVTAGGAQTVTTSNGSFLVEGLPPGEHNLVLYAFDGSFQTFQQGAVIAIESTTPAKVEMVEAPLVKVTFTVSVPDGTLPAVPIRLAGNLEQLGNTFSDLSGGMNTLASRMPTLTAISDDLYSLEAELPSGAYVEYKYTLGDGFWNAEHTSGGDFKIRTMTVPDTDIQIKDHIDNWGDLSDVGPILFDLNVPSNTPEFDYVSIQFNPFGWTEPIPMWKLGENHWVYMLYSPIANQENFTYRYCRNDQCGRADDEATPGDDSPGRSLSILEGMQSVEDTVDAWFWYKPESSAGTQEDTDKSARDQNFITGVEIQSYFHPSLIPRSPVALKEIESLGSRWVFLTPSWTYTRQNPPVLEPVTGQDPTWSEVSTIARKAQSFELDVSLNPGPRFPTETDSWWSSSERDFAWWNVWFERYENFILHFADLAQSEDIEGLVIGGEWVSPALPDGKLSDGEPSGVPADAESRWRKLIATVREHYDGTLFWALPSSESGIDPPIFIEDLDHVYLLWSLPLTNQAEPAIEQLRDTAFQYLDSEVFPVQLNLEMPFTLAVAYPSAAGALQGCISITDEVGEKSCLDSKFLEPPYPDTQYVSRDQKAQEQAYSALLMAFDEHKWLDGFVTRGYYSPAELNDKSTSVHGKPAQTILRVWFNQFTYQQLEEE